MTAPVPQPPPRDRIHRELRAALALSGLSVRQVAQDLGVTPDHLYMVSTGRRQSRRLRQVLDDFIAGVLADDTAGEGSPEARHEAASQA
jgi:hypothetical protein